MIKVFSDIEELSNFAAETFIEIGNAAIEKLGQFSVVLAGGSTPKSLYQLLAGENFKDKIDWKSVYFFFGDERNVLPDDKQSNFLMAGESLLKPLQITDNQIFRWQTELGDATAIAANYEKIIGRVFNLEVNPPATAGGSDIFPHFDLILLGMGADGHTASLFPETDALQETEKIAVANWVEKLQDFRLTMTFPTINNASNIIFLVSGAEKAKTLKQVLHGRFQPEIFPSQAVKPINGDLIWLIDEKAAQFLA